MGWISESPFGPGTGSECYRCGDPIVLGPGDDHDVCEDCATKAKQDEPEEDD